MTFAAQRKYAPEVIIWYHSNTTIQSSGRLLYDPRNLKGPLVHQSHFTKEETEAQGVSMPRLHSYSMRDPGLEFGKFLE